MKAEERIHTAICNYIKLQYPDVYFLSDPSGIFGTIGTAVKAKKIRSKHAQLDLVILHPNDEFNGLILEVKNGLGQVYKKNMEFRKSEHVYKQNLSIMHLNNLGYKAMYAFSLDQAIYIIDDYML